jgi:uncharacterized membrane protein YccC
VGGAGLAVLSGMTIINAWDKKLLPSYFADAVWANYDYFRKAITTPQPIAHWTKFKRAAESSNSNAYDSFSRHMQEPGRDKAQYYYNLILSNIYLTRYLNSVLTEQEEKKTTSPIDPAQQERKINECADWFSRVLSLTDRLAQHSDSRQANSEALPSYPLNQLQLFYLEKLLLELKEMHQELERLTDKQHVE